MGLGVGLLVACREVGGGGTCGSLFSKVLVGERGCGGGSLLRKVGTGSEGGGFVGGCTLLPAVASFEVEMDVIAGEVSFTRVMEGTSIWADSTVGVG